MENKKNEDIEDCMECRLTSGFGCLGIGTYVMYQGRQLKGLNFGGIMVLGGGFGLLGVARLLGISLFNKDKIS